jgi:hypothetical protein
VTSARAPFIHISLAGPHINPRTPRQWNLRNTTQGRDRRRRRFRYLALQLSSPAPPGTSPPYPSPPLRSGRGYQASEDFEVSEERAVTLPAASVAGALITEGVQRALRATGGFRATISGSRDIVVCLLH